MKPGLISIVLVAALIVASCCDAYKKSEEIQDSSVHYFLDTVASLGTEIIIHYKNNRPASGSILIQEEKKRTLINYLFIKDSILVSEYEYYYKHPLSLRKNIHNENLKTDVEDSVFFIRYIIDYDGAVIWKSDSLNEIKEYYSLIDSLL